MTAAKKPKSSVSSIKVFQNKTRQSDDPFFYDSGRDKLADIVSPVIIGDDVLIEYIA